MRRTCKLVSLFASTLTEWEIRIIIMVSNDTLTGGVHLTSEYKRIERKDEVNAYLQNLKYAIINKADLVFQARRYVDEHRQLKFTNQYTIQMLFPDENPVDVLKRELTTLSVENYICTVKDLRFPQKSEMREFGKVYHGKEDVYIKLRVELFGFDGAPSVFVMSFHFAETSFKADMFPYRTTEKEKNNEGNR